MYPRQTPLFRLILSGFAASILSVFTIIALTFFSGTTVIHAQDWSISGRVWDDANTNGVVDAGETGIPNTTVVLYDVTSGTCQSVHTGNDGSYSFSGLNPGDYRIYEAAGESTPSPANCPPTESVADSNTKTVTPGSIADPDDYLSSTPNRIDVTLNSDLIDQNFGDFHSTPFASCIDWSFLTQNTPSDLYRVNLVTGSANILASGWPTTTNAIGYNILNNYIFGYDVTTRGRITVIDASYNITSLDVQGLGNNVKAYVGDVSTEGYLYLHDGNQTVRIVDVNPQRTTYLTLINVMSLSKTTNIADWAFNPTDGKLYGVNNVGNVIQTDPDTGVVRNLGNPGITEDGLFGAVYFDNAGFLFASHNNTGKIYRIDLRPPIQSPPEAILFTNGPSSSKNDGARCPYAPSALLDCGDAPDVNGQTSGKNMAFHAIDANGPYLGSTPPDEEFTGSPTTNADGDDNADSNDEDGLSGFVGVDDDWSDGGAIEVDVSNVGNNGACVYAWVDWEDNGFGVGNDSTSQVDVSSAGTVTVNFNNNLPSQGDFPDSVYLRLRVVSGACSSLAATGGASDGEVEDFLLNFTPTAITLQAFAAASTPSIWLGGALLAGLGLLGGVLTLRKS